MMPRSEGWTSPQPHEARGRAGRERLGRRDGAGRQAESSSQPITVSISQAAAQRAADAEASESRRGIDETEESVATRLSAIRSDLARGLSPGQMSAPGGEGLGSRAPACRWAGVALVPGRNRGLAARPLASLAPLPAT